MNEPKLRFKTDGEIPFPDWEKKELSDICELITVGIANSATQAYRDTGVIMFRNQNIKENYLDTSDLIYIDPEFEKRYKKKRLKADDLLIVRTGYPGTACLVPPEYEDAQTFTTLIARLIKNENVPAYVCQYINSPLGKSYFESTQIGGGQKNSGAKILENFPISLPSLPEQQKIAFLFTELDTIIQSAEKALEGYRELKQGMLQKMFPKKGEKVPEIRFPEFTGDWEQHKLGEVAPLRGGYAFKSDKYKTEGTPIVRISNILSDGSVGAEFAYYDDIEDDKKCTLGNGDALLAMSGATTGKVSILKCNNNDKYYQNQRVGYFERNEQYNYGFVSTIVRSDLFKEQLTLVLVAGAQPNVSSKEIDAFEFMFPNSIVEQKKIGEYFSNLDNLIALQQQELDGYKELKKGLLQQMFC